MGTILPNQPTKLTLGQAVEVTKTFTVADVANFAELSGDCNPLHLDADYAATTMFKKPIVHGVLMNG